MLACPGSWPEHLKWRGPDTFTHRCPEVHRNESREEGKEAIAHGGWRETGPGGGWSASIWRSQAYNEGATLQRCKERDHGELRTLIRSSSCRSWSILEPINSEEGFSISAAVSCGGGPTSKRVQKLESYSCKLRNLMSIFNRIYKSEANAWRCIDHWGKLKRALAWCCLQLASTSYSLLSLQYSSTIFTIDRVAVCIV